MIRHVVSWNFRPELTEEQRQSVREEVLTRLHALKGQLSYLRDIHAYCPPLDGSNCDLVSHGHNRLAGRADMHGHSDHDLLGLGTQRNHSQAVGCFLPVIGMHAAIKGLLHRSTSQIWPTHGPFFRRVMFDRYTKQYQ